MSSFFLSVLSLASLALIPAQDLVCLENLNAEETENESDLSSDHFFSEEEELTAVPQKGHRPQVIQIPSKTSLPR